ncbi:Anti-sigma-K factor RskA [Paenimyroides ummariense]|uniref:Anti-sigma-K factor RskA n=1 Tax=Paenimyroides ummariense TaxID=913024 RepID=A0A1I5G9A8_9FLAO|nr:anti-sigma factor [Paenimyroides ummariense]SFO32580.1 Anti-sigma-K factor RskA [Paenimyroides ummariense]
MNTKEYISSGIIESYVLGIATGEEAAIFECIMKNNAEVKAAYLEAQRIMEELAAAQAVAPPVDLKAKVWDKIKQQTASEPLVSNINSSQQKSVEVKQLLAKASPGKWKKWAVAASVLFVVGLASNIFWWQQQIHTRSELNLLAVQLSDQGSKLEQVQKKWALASNSDIQTIQLNGVEKHPGSKAIVFWDKSTKNVYLHSVNLPQPPKGMQYQLWAIENGKPVSAGMYSPEKDTEIVLSTIQSAQNFAITLEKAGGVESPTLQNMYVIGGV